MELEVDPEQIDEIMLRIIGDEQQSAPQIIEKL